MNKIPDRFTLYDLLRRPDLARELLRAREQQRNLQYVLPGGEVRRARYGDKSLDATIDLGVVETAVSSLPQAAPETNAWSELAVANGGCVTPTAIAIADATSRAIAAASFANKILMLWPFLGCNVISARVPLIDQLGKGLAVNHGFADADFAQTTGLQGNGSAYFDSLCKPSDLGGATGGLGWWEMSVPGSTVNVHPMGSYLQSNIPDNRFALDLRPTLRGFYWGTVPATGDTTAAGNGHYYGQSASAVNRKLYFGGSQIASDTSAVDTNCGPLTMLLSGCNAGNVGIIPWAGRGFLAYMTDGSLTDTEVATLHALLLKYLVNPKIAGVAVPFGSGFGDDSFPNPSAEDDTDDCNTCADRILVSATGEVLVSATGKVLLSATT